MLSIKTCTDCSRPMAAGRADKRPPGTVEQTTRELCNTCYHRKRRGTIGAGQNPQGRAPLLRDDGIVDDVAIEHAALGRKDLRLTRRELRLAAQRLTDYGCSASSIADVLGVSERVIVRYRTGMSSDPALTLVAA